MRIVFFLLRPLIFSIPFALADSGFSEKYERDYNIFNPASQYAPDTSLNPAQSFAPDNPFNPLSLANCYTPGTHFAPLTRLR